MGVLDTQWETVGGPPRPPISLLRWDGSDWIETNYAALPAWIGRRSRGRTGGVLDRLLTTMAEWYTQHLANKPAK
jgi:hypothetical protein